MMPVSWWLMLACWAAINVAGAMITCIVTDRIVGIRKKGKHAPGQDVTVAAQGRSAPGRAEDR